MKPYLTVLLSFMLLLSACDNKEKSVSQQVKAPPPPTVGVIQAEKRAIQPKFEYPAVIEAVEHAAVRGQVLAAIKAHFVHPGAMVKKGDLLFELDDSEYVVAVDAAKAGLASANAGAKEALANWVRAQELQPKGYISGQDFDLARAKSDTAQAAIKQAENKLERAKLDLEHTKIYAPFDGKISAANYAVGDIVQPGDPTQPKPLCEIVKLDPIYAVAHVDQQKYDNFILKRKELEDKGMKIPPLELSIMLPGNKKYPYKGEFESWDFAAAANKGTIAGRAHFPNPDELLLPGRNVTLKGRVINVIEHVIIPQKAVSQDQQGYYLLTLTEDNTVVRKPVELGLRHESDWAVISGIERGDRVIVSGLHKARPGGKVLPKDASHAVISEAEIMEEATEE